MADLKSTLMSGNKIYGTMTRALRVPAGAQFVKNSGLDFFMCDCEHANFSMESLHDLFLMANALDVGGFVRVPIGTKEWISRVLDCGATGVMIPMVNNREEAEAIAKYSKYLPVGDRGFASNIAYSSYKGGKHVEIMAAQNDRVIAIAQIETLAGLENVDDIASVEGIDALLIGPNDLSIALGIPGDLMNPIEINAIQKVADACKKYGKAFGLHAGAPMLAKFKDDLNIVMCSTDIDVITSGFAAINKTIREL